MGPSSDHLHTIWTLPPEDTDYSRRWAFLKKEFTKAYLANGGEEVSVTPGRARDGRRGVWQPKFWEHTMRDQRDYERHFHYLHFKPVKHGHAENPTDYPYSTFHRHVKAGIYPPDWASSTGHREPLDFEGLDIASIECDAFGE